MFVVNGESACRKFRADPIFGLFVESCGKLFTAGYVEGAEDGSE